MVNHSLCGNLCLNFQELKARTIFKDTKTSTIIFYTALITLVVLFGMDEAFAQNIPGEDESQKLEGLGTLLKITDTVVFSWGTKLLSGVCVVAAGWSFKEQRIPIAVLCIIASIVLALAGRLVKNAFDVGGGGTIFTTTQIDKIKSFEERKYPFLRVG